MLGGDHIQVTLLHISVNPAQQGQADVIHVPCTGAGGTTAYAIRDLVPVKS
jgi:hypothetical protein